jgi:hypothetical protein
VRFPKASINYWLTTHYGGQVVSNAKEVRAFMKEIENWPDEEFVRASVEGDYGQKEVSSKDELLEIMWDYAVGPPIN